MEGFWGHLSRLHALGLGLLWCPPVPGPHNVPAPQPQGRARRARVLGRQAINGAGVAVASRVPGNWRPSNHAKNVSCHPGSQAIRLAQLRPQVPGPRSTVGCRSRFHRSILDGRPKHICHTARHTRQHFKSSLHRAAHRVTTACIAYRPAWPPVVVHPIVGHSDNNDHKNSNSKSRLYAP